MTILVVGAGATGGYFGARLADAGRDVTFLVRGHRAAQLRERGLRIVGPGAAEPVTPQLVTADQLTGAADIVLVSVKATAVEAAITDFAPAVGPQTLVIPFLNGLGHLATLSKRFGEHAVLGGVVKVATQLTDDGDICQLAPGASLEIGAQDGSCSVPLQAAFDQLSGAGFEVSISDEIVAAMWHKWVFIAAIGALTCLMRGTVGDIVAVPGGRELRPGDPRRGVGRRRRGRLPGPGRRERGYGAGRHPGRLIAGLVDVPRPDPGPPRRGRAHPRRSRRPRRRARRGGASAGSRHDAPARLRPPAVRTHKLKRS